MELIGFQDIAVLAQQQLFQILHTEMEFLLQYLNQQTLLPVLME